MTGGVARANIWPRKELPSAADDNEAPLPHDQAMQLSSTLTWLVDAAGSSPGADRFLAELGAHLIADGLPVPRPAPAGQPRGDEAIARLPALTALKTELYWALGDAGITRAELQRRLGWNRESVDRLFRLDHASRLEQIEAAFHALGRKINVSVEEHA